MKKILVIRYRFIGDTVLTIPFLRNLRAAYPDAQIDMLVGPISGDVLLNCPYIDNLITFDTTRKHQYENTKQEKKSFFTYVNILKKNKYDKAYVLKRSFSSAALAFFAGIPERVGFDTEHRGIFLTKKFKYIENRHEVECFLDVLRKDNIQVKDTYLENWVSKESKSKINRIFHEYNTGNHKKVLIHATSGNKNKHWEAENFARVIEYLVNNKDIQVFYTGTEDDKNAYNEMHSHLKQNLRIEPINLCGQLSIQDSMALISEMNFVLGVDSGTLHLAASLNIPVIGIYGPMNPIKWQAWGNNHIALYSNMDCIPCGLKKPCPNDIACLKEITPNIVIGECEKVLRTV